MNDSYYNCGSKHSSRFKKARASEIRVFSRYNSRAKMTGQGDSLRPGSATRPEGKDITRRKLSSVLQFVRLFYKRKGQRA